MAGFDFFLWHGVCLTIAWTLFALVQISTNRYMKGTNWKTHMWIHRISGLIITVVTLVFAFWALSKVGWKFLSMKPHAWAAVIVLSCVLLIVMGGVLTRSMLRRLVWNTKTALLIKRVHKIGAYSLIAVALVAIWFGIWDYRHNPKHLYDLALEWIVIAPIVLFVIIEVVYQKSLNEESKYEMTTKVQDAT